MNPRTVMIGLLAALGACAVTALAGQAPPPGLVVRVLDTSGAPVAGALVTLTGTAAARRVYETGNTGEAAIPLAGVEPADALVSAAGFADVALRLPARAGLVTVILAPSRLLATVSVVASRGDTPVGIPASTTVVGSGTMLTSAAAALDDVLRSTPGFSLFRRSSSRTANPTTQGVTLRGVSGSGASRTVVLADGLPLNDPFGSWVYWNRVPQAAIAQVEVARGPAGDVWGADALGGVVRIRLAEDRRSRARLFMEGGSQATVRGSAYGGAVLGHWTASGAVEANRTDGAFTVAQADRGGVDVPAFSDYSTGTAAVAWQDGLWRAKATGSAYDEQRGNGTPLQVNDTSWGRAAGTVGGGLLHGFWEARVSGGRQTYEQSFTAVAPDRNTERLTSRQRIPTGFIRSDAQWVRQVGRHDVALGLDWHGTDAVVDETQYSLSGAPLVMAETGGQERGAAAFARAQLVPGGAWTVNAGARVDRWETTPRNPLLARHAATLLSPRVSVSWAKGPNAVTLTAARAYRAPTLNELYRGFRAGNVVTNPNDQLDPERLTSVEAGWVRRGGSWSLRTTGFVNVLDGAIANLTVRTTPLLITRQRANSDRIDAKGAEFELEWRPLASLAISGQIAWTDSRFGESLANPGLVGNVVPQVPAWSLGGSITWSDPRWLTVALQARGSSRAFDDDLNTLPLNPFGIVDLYVARAVARSFQGFVAAENIFDVQYDVARTPLRSIGWPRSVRGGVRVFLH